jgi:hypothetical protein
MSAHIDFRTLPASVPSLCIPRVFTNIGEGRIRKIFVDLDIGVIDRIDIVAKTTEKGEKFNRVFIHFKKWLDNENANNSRERLLNGKDIKIIYDEPWFWKVSAYREPAKKPNRGNSLQKVPSLNVDAPVFMPKSDLPVIAKGLSVTAPTFVPAAIAPALPKLAPMTPPGPPPPTNDAKLAICLEKINDLRIKEEEPRVDEGLDIDYNVGSIPPPCPRAKKFRK